ARLARETKARLCGRQLFGRHTALHNLPAPEVRFSYIDVHRLALGIREGHAVGRRDALTRRHAALLGRQLLLIVIRLHALGCDVERITGLYAEIAAGRGVVVRSFADELHTAARIGLVELHG